MYEAFYGLKEKPFTLLPDPEYLYLSPKHQRALTLLEYGMLNHAGFSVICGDTGAGKTTLIRRLLSELGDDTTVGLITNTHQSFGELLNWVLMAFGLDGEGRSKAQMHQMFVEFLIEQYADNKHTVLIVDEAQNMSADTLEELRMLSNINADKDQVLQVILAGQPALRETLRQPELMQFAQRISVDYYLEALSLEETRAYVAHRLLVAGAKDAIFTDEACQAIFKFSGGTPRLINLLCDTAMVYGFAEQTKIIDAQLIHDVVEEQHSNSIVPTFNTGEKSHSLSATKQTIEQTAASQQVTLPSVEERSDIEEEHAAQKVEDAIARLAERAVQALHNAEEVVTSQHVKVSSSDVQLASSTHMSQEETDTAQLQNTNVTPISSKQHLTDVKLESGSQPERQPERQIVEQNNNQEEEAGSEIRQATEQQLTESELDNEHKRDDEGEAGRADIHDEVNEYVDETQAKSSGESHHSQHDEVYPIVHVEESPKKTMSLILVGLVGGMFVASVGMVAIAWMLFNSTDLNQGLTGGGIQTQPISNEREVETLQKERDAALAMTRALELERDAALSAAKAQEAMRQAEMRAAEILAQQEREAEARLREARARARAAERAEQKALERERLVRLKAIERETELKAQREETKKQLAETAAARQAATEVGVAPSQAASGQTAAIEVRPAAGTRQAESSELNQATRVTGNHSETADAEKHSVTATHSAQKEKFTSNPCNSASAKFLSTCKR